MTAQRRCLVCWSVAPSADRAPRLCCRTCYRLLYAQFGRYPRAAEIARVALRDYWPTWIAEHQAARRRAAA